MALRVRQGIGSFVAVVVGLGLGFFFLFGSLFSDGPSHVQDPERLWSYATTAGAYFVATFLLVWLFQLPSWITAFVLLAPGTIIALLYAGKEPGIWNFAIIYLGFAWGAACLGAAVSARWPLRRATGKT